MSPGWVYWYWNVPDVPDVPDVPLNWYLNVRTEKPRGFGLEFEQTRPAVRPECAICGNNGSRGGGGPLDPAGNAGSLAEGWRKGDP